MNQRYRVSSSVDLYAWLRDFKPRGRTANAFECGAMRRLRGDRRGRNVYQRSHERAAEEEGWDAMDAQLREAPMRCNHCNCVVPKTARLELRP